MNKGKAKKWGKGNCPACLSSFYAPELTTPKVIFAFMLHSFVMEENQPPFDSTVTNIERKSLMDQVT